MGGGIKWGGGGGYIEGGGELILIYRSLTLLRISPQGTKYNYLYNHTVNIFRKINLVNFVDAGITVKVNNSCEVNMLNNCILYM